MKRRPMNRRKDRKIFTRTANRTKSINVSLTNRRGGTIL